MKPRSPEELQQKKGKPREWPDAIEIRGEIALAEIS